MGYVHDDDEGVFDPLPDDLPDLPTLVWKLARTAVSGTDVPELDADEDEYIRHLLAAGCPICGGTGQNGMDREGNPYECKTCKGKGR